MQLITSTFSLTICFALLLSSPTQADNIASDLCWCYSDSIVGFAHEHTYYNEMQQKTYHWVNSCMDKRMRRLPTVDFACKDPMDIDSCEPLPDVTKYHCIDRIHDEHCNKATGPGKVCRQHHYVRMDGDSGDMTLSGRLFRTPRQFGTARGPNCVNVCNVAFGSNEQISRGLKPLCNSTYLLHDKNFGKELPITTAKRSNDGACILRTSDGMIDLRPRT